MGHSPQAMSKNADDESSESQLTIPEQLAYFVDYHPPRARFLTDVLNGFSNPQKSIPPKYFYDERGSALFDEICHLKEYYIPQTELDILEMIGSDLRSHLGSGANIIEYGSGSSQKIRTLLEDLQDPAEYLAIDISRTHLIAAAKNLALDFQDLRVGAVCADFTLLSQLPEEAATGQGKRIGFFPGSTIGNFSDREILHLLRNMYALLGPGDVFLVGVDLKKDAHILHEAYNDPSGVTAQFNLNLLVRLNEELGATIDGDTFTHDARYVASQGRIEMHLVSQIDQTIKVGNQDFSFAKGESIHTENSRKFDVREFQAMAKTAGFTPQDVWTDPEELFSVHLLKI